MVSGATTLIKKKNSELTRNQEPSTRVEGLPWYTSLV